jgi:hypothetical protein
MRVSRCIRINWMLSIAAVWMCTGCSQLISLHPFVTEQDAELDPRLPGVWTGGQGDELYIVRQDGNGYTISYSEKSSAGTYKLKAKLFKTGETRILDLTPAEEDAFQIPAHTPLRVWMEGATLRIAFLDSQWLRGHAGAELAVQDMAPDTGVRVLITAPGDAVTRFLLTYGGDERAFGEPIVLTRLE